MSAIKLLTLDFSSITVQPNQHVIGYDVLDGVLKHKNDQQVLTPICLANKIYEIGEIDFNDMNDWTGDKSTTIVFPDVATSFTGFTGASFIVKGAFAKTTETFVQDYPYADEVVVRSIGLYAPTMIDPDGSNIDSFIISDAYSGGAGGFSYMGGLRYISGGGNTAEDTTMVQSFNSSNQVDIGVALMTKKNIPQSGGWTAGVMKIYCEVASVPEMP